MLVTGHYIREKSLLNGGESEMDGFSCPRCGTTYDKSTLICPDCCLTTVDAGSYRDCWYGPLLMWLDQLFFLGTE
jgi:predicted amidophosphoribosyltransferase